MNGGDPTGVGPPDGLRLELLGAAGERGAGWLAEIRPAVVYEGADGGQRATLERPFAKRNAVSFIGVRRGTVLSGPALQGNPHVVDRRVWATGPGSEGASLSCRARFGKLEDGVCALLEHRSGAARTWLRRGAAQRLRSEHWRGPGGSKDD